MTVSVLSLTPAAIFQNATLLVKLDMAALALAAVVALVVCVVKLASGPRLTGGSAFLSGLRLGGPLAGLLGAAYGGVNMALGVANVPYPVTAKILAPGFAEALALILLGLIVGVVAVIANWAVEARIDRKVLAA
ncbi:MAG TPA: MotA/TolQ/ExbB proton channel family protein [Caulobacteraceae bacterium]|jgi:biopolymer transport protein ExbB/TolQ|nr:MotA/TolQ/ExbB proton channel family protein [Caulobacteraceae bacterium]